MKQLENPKSNLCFLFVCLFVLVRILGVGISLVSCIKQGGHKWLNPLMGFFIHVTSLPPNNSHSPAADPGSGASQTVCHWIFPATIGGKYHFLFYKKKTGSQEVHNLPKVTQRK